MKSIGADTLKTIANGMNQGYIYVDERKIIEEALVRHGGNRKKAIEELEISKSIFYEKIKKYGINAE